VSRSRSLGLGSRPPRCWATLIRRGAALVTVTALCEGGRTTHELNCCAGLTAVAPLPRPAWRGSESNAKVRVSRCWLRTNAVAQVCRPHVAASSSHRGVVPATLHERQSRPRAEAAALVLAGDRIPASGEVRWRADPKGVPHRLGGGASRRRARRRGSSRSHPRARPGFRRGFCFDPTDVCRVEPIVQRHPGRSTFAPGLEEPRWRARVRSRAAQTRHPGRSRCPNAGWMGSETAALGTPSELARYEGPL